MTFFLICIVLTFFSESRSDKQTNISIANSHQLPCNNQLADKRQMDEYCHRKFDALVSSIHNFSDCIMQNSLSYGACASCGDHYQYYNERKYTLETDVRQDKNNRTCAESMHDTKISLIDFEEKSPISLWTNGSCGNCYHFNDVSKKVELHPDYVQFRKFIVEYQGCVDEHRGKSLCNLTYICGNCSKEYLELVHFYHTSVNDKKSFLLCLDVKQKINASAHEWSHVFKCGRLTKTDRFATYALSAFVILLPIAFYVGVYVQSEDKGIVYEFVPRSNFKPADDGDVGHSIEVPHEIAGAGAASNVRFYIDDHEEDTPHGFERSGRRLNSTVPSVGTGSIVHSSVSSTNNLLM